MENTKIVESLRKQELKSNEITLLEKSFIVIPYQVSGYLDITNKGFVDRQLEPSEVETFKRMWTGNDAVVIQWLNSIKLVQDKQDAKNVKIEYQLGDYFAGIIKTNDSFTNIAKDSSFSEYTSQEIEKVVNMTVQAKHFKIPDYYQLLLFKIPEYSKSTLYYIENIERNFIGLNNVAYTITFRTINQKLANTGRARQQNIQASAPGQGYLEADVYNEKDYKLPEHFVEGKEYYRFYGRLILANDSNVFHNPVCKANVRFNGLALVGSINFIGRPAHESNTIGKFETPRLIFPTRIEKSMTPSLFHASNNNTNYYFGDFEPQLETTVPMLKELMGIVLGNALTKNDNQGVLAYNSDIDKSNPMVDGNFKFNLDKDWEIPQRKKTLTTSGMAGVSPTYKLDNVAKWNKIHHKFFDNYWIWKGDKTLPLVNFQKYQGDVLVSLIHDALNIINPFNWISAIVTGQYPPFALGREKRKGQKAFPYRAIVSAPFMDASKKFFSNVVGLANKTPLEMISNDNDNTLAGLMFPNSSIETSFSCELSDKLEVNEARISEFYDNNWKDLSTLNIGQKYTEYGSKIREDNEPLLVDGDLFTIKERKFFEEKNGYIIDGFQISSIFDGEYSIEFLDRDDNIVWTGVYQSQGKWTGALREIWTERSTSTFGRDNVYFTQPLPYPLAPSIPGTPYWLMPETNKVTILKSIYTTNVDNRIEETKPKLGNEDFEFGMVKDTSFYSQREKRDLIVTSYFNSGVSGQTHRSKMKYETVEEILENITIMEGELSINSNDYTTSGALFNKDKELEVIEDKNFIEFVTNNVEKNNKKSKIWIENGKLKFSIYFRDELLKALREDSVERASIKLKSNETYSMSVKNPPRYAINFDSGINGGKKTALYYPYDNPKSPNSLNTWNIFDFGAFNLQIQITPNKESDYVILDLGLYASGWFNLYWDYKINGEPSEERYKAQRESIFLNNVTFKNVVIK